MFIKANDFKKLINKAAASSWGLHVKNDGAAIWLSASSWKIWILRTEIPNQQLGDLIALGGMLPDPGDAVCIQRDTQQVEMFETEPMSAMDLYKQCNVRYYVTRTVVWEDGYQRVLQADDRGFLPICVDNDMVAAVRPEVIRLDRHEDLPDGPMVIKDPGNSYHSLVVCWANNQMAFSAATHRPNTMFDDVRNMNNIRMRRIIENEDREDSGEE